MKLVLALAALAAVACSSPVAPRHFVPQQSRTLNVGDPCTTSDGRSGYIVYAGNKLVCEA